WRGGERDVDTAGAGLEGGWHGGQGSAGDVPGLILDGHVPGQAGHRDLPGVIANRHVTREAGNGDIPGVRMDSNAGRTGHRDGERDTAVRAPRIAEGQRLTADRVRDGWPTG